MIELRPRSGRDVRLASMTAMGAYRLLSVANVIRSNGHQSATLLSLDLMRGQFTSVLLAGRSAD